MLNVREFHYPRTVAQTLEILLALDGKGLVIAGGTSVSTWKDPRVTALVDVTRLGLAFVRKNGAALRLGAVVSLHELATNEDVAGYASGLVSRAAASAPSRMLRNVRTLGGHIIPSTPHTELAPALLALDATVFIARLGVREERVGYDTFSSESRYRKLGRNELLTEVLLPAEWAKASCAYQTFSRTASDPAWVQVAVAVRRRGKAVEDARFALGGVARRAVRVPAVETLLRGAIPSESLCAQAALQALSGVDVQPDWRASEEYRRQIVTVVARRALEEALSVGGQGGR